MIRRRLDRKGEFADAIAAKDRREVVMSRDWGVGNRGLHRAQERDGE